ncbi:phage tail protein [Xenorhabdus cabanillasii]|uniref:phage tail protein n=1 Tax=Xenorhabdus cabanillasii TaxID=351673 RepID=UPI002B408CAB|nr:phage tail protein [Xenorhabdus sp. Flor]
MQDKKPDAPVSEDSNLVTVTTPEYVKEAIEEHAQSRNHPNATLQDKGFVILSNDVGSDSETMAATPKAVKAAYDLANTANQNALNNNSNLYLEKKQNGADIPDKAAFVENIGLAGTEEQAKNFASFKLKSTNIEYRGQNLAYQKLIDFRSEPYKTLMNKVGRSVTAEEQQDKLTTMPNGLTCGLVEIQDLTPNSFGYSGMGSLINARGWYDDTGLGAHLQLISTGGFLAFRNGVGSTFSDMIQIRHYRNTYLDSNGSLKETAPVIKIWGDGRFETNDESEGATIERLSEGIYHIKGIQGVNNDEIWGGIDNGIDIPLCKNKLPLIWVDNEILPDGSIKLMTYHREHSDSPIFARNLREGYSDGDLIDIPEGRFVSVRVQMPSAKGE